MALTDNNPFPSAADPALPDKATLWLWIRSALGTSRCSWTERHGLSFEADNLDFWNLLIPGVGLPPVNAFRLLITLFVVLIGPVNYFVLRRLGWLHFLLLTVPAGSALVSLGLVGYALASDGLGIRLRARSYTLLDQHTGQAVTWSRLSYYAGLAPYAGLTFSRDTAVFPFESDFSLQSQSLRTTVWDEQQHLASGWLPSRTVTQLLAVRSGPERKRLEITPETNSLKVTNHLQTDIALAVIADRAGRLYQFSALAAGESATVDPLPADPAGGEQSSIPLAFTSAVMNRRGGGAIGPASPVSPLLGMNPQFYNPQPGSFGGQGTSLLDLSLRRCEGAAAGPVIGLSPGSFLALVEQADPALLGVATAEEVGSLHVIEGKW